MGIAAKGRRRMDDGESSQLRERLTRYGDDLGSEKGDIEGLNA